MQTKFQSRFLIAISAKTISTSTIYAWGAMTSLSVTFYRFLLRIVQICKNQVLSLFLSTNFDQ